MHVWHEGRGQIQWKVYVVGGGGGVVVKEVCEEVESRGVEVVGCEGDGEEGESGFCLEAS